METSLTTDLIQGLIAAFVLIIPFWKIHEKAGFHPALSLIIFIPWLGLVVSPLILAFAPWPYLKNSKNN
ncbi:MAG: hypothetical protein KZQ77_18350 [Candidatus Thiodiazotropha sp. (ex Notomyrtea botanica)]|nr:hypothetical protein [Candidatus Thiodiazotropha sp. (ex Notomyrtea botanica)]